MPSYRIKRKRTERLNFKPQLQVETMKRLESIFHGVQKTKTSTLDTKAAVKKNRKKKEKKASQPFGHWIQVIHHRKVDLF